MRALINNFPLGNLFRMEPGLTEDKLNLLVLSCYELILVLSYAKHPLNPITSIFFNQAGILDLDRLPKSFLPGMEL